MHWNKFIKSWIIVVQWKSRPLKNVSLHGEYNGAIYVMIWNDLGGDIFDFVIEI